jgi:hypothetical protein
MLLYGNIYEHISRFVGVSHVKNPSVPNIMGEKRRIAFTKRELMQEGEDIGDARSVYFRAENRACMAEGPDMVNEVGLVDGAT